MKKRVILIGPKLDVKNSFYGGGTGGYTRNFKMYLSEFNFDDFEIIPFYATIRMRNQIKLFSFPLRLWIDVVGLIRLMRREKPSVIHILGQYRSSAIRELIWIWISHLFRVKVIYEIKAGQFVSELECSSFNRFIYKYLLFKSDKILCEGRFYVEYLKKNFDLNSIYFPNGVATNEIPKFVPKKQSNPLRLLFVGYCYEGKGVFELINAVNTKLTIPLEVRIIGEESIPFKEFMGEFVPRERLKIERFGKRDHSFVLTQMADCEVYVYPSKHKGEGHNNTINEALMNSMIIISSKAGFIEDILKDVGYLMDGVSEEKIAEKLMEINQQFPEASERAVKGRLLIEEHYNSTKLGDILNSVYKSLT